MTRRIACLFLWIWFLAACSPIIVKNRLEEPGPTIQPAINAGIFTIEAEPADQQAAEDVAKALQSHQEAICGQLQIKCDFQVLVELYPNQASFDEHVMNQAFRGYYAISGQQKIQMLSPNVPPTGQVVPYGERVQIAVHEFVHLALDEIEPNLPDWLDEGTAIYLAPHAVYDLACQQALLIEQIPELHDLIETYSTIPAADLYAYTLVRFIVEQDGMGVLNQLLRSPSRRTEYIEKNPNDFEAEWHSFLEKTCTGGITPASLRSHLEEIAGDMTGGRLPTTPGYDLAADYAAQVFEQAELALGWKDTRGAGSFFQSVPLLCYTLGPENFLGYQTHYREGILSYADFWYALAYPGNGKKVLGDGRVVYIGYGIHEPEYGWDDYAGVELKNAIVFLEVGVPEEEPGFNLPPNLVEAYVSGAKSKILPLTAQGVAAIIMIRPTNMSWDRLFNSYRLLNYVPEQWADPAMPPILFLNPDWENRFFMDQVYHPLTRIGRYQSFRLEEISLQLSIDVTLQPVQSTNIIAVLKGVDPALQEEYIVLSAHLDHLGEIDGDVYNGANDDATGCAAVMEIAKVLAVTPPRRSVIFALFTCEEQSHCGADFFIDHPPVPLDQIVANINLEVLGGVSPDTARIGVIAPSSLAELARELSSMAAPIPLEVDEPEQKMDLYQNGDQLSFYQRGIPAVLIASGALEENHTPEDDIRLINFEHLSRVTHFILRYLLNVANRNSELGS